MRTSIYTKRIVTLALAAALLLALGVTAWASLDAGEWFKSWFGGGQLSEAQQERIQSGAAAIGESQTADGWTVTLDSVYAERYRCFIRLDVTAPEGAALKYPMFETVRLTSTDAAVPEDIFSGGTSVCWPAEEGGPDSAAGLLLELAVPLSLREGDFAFDAPFTLTLERLEEHSSPETLLLSEGVWTFTFSLPQRESRERTLLAEPLTLETMVTTSFYDGEPYDPVRFPPDTIDPRHLQTGKIPAELTVSSITLTEMEAYITFTWDKTQFGDLNTVVRPDLEFADSLELTLADGSTVRANGSFILSEENADGTYTDVAVFAAPIVLDEVVSAAFQGQELTISE